MLPNTTYLMRHVLDDGTVSAPLTFTTGSLPANLTFPTFTVVQPPAAGTDLSQDMIFHAGLGDPTGTVNTVATDLNGNVIWYYDPVANGFPGYAQNLEPGGTVMMLGGNAVGVAGGYDTLRQVDLAGDTLRETNIHAVNAELAAMRQPRSSTSTTRPSSCPTATRSSWRRTPKTVNYKGTPTKFIGNMVIVLDQNFQLAWVWNSFHWLDTNRLGTDRRGPERLAARQLRELVARGRGPGGLPAHPGLGDQDRLRQRDRQRPRRLEVGAGRRFHHQFARTHHPWFSHQHDVRYINDTTLLVFDDGNTRQRVRTRVRIAAGRNGSSTSRT